MKRVLLAACLACGLQASAFAGTITLDVFARANSVSGGTGAAAGTVNAGDLLTISSNTNDLWNAGALPRWSNANGLTGTLLATGSDESGQAAGTQIGANFGQFSSGGLSAPFGTLVGQIGGGAFFTVGTFFSAAAPSSGALKLYYWDSNNGDNSDSIRVTVRTSGANNVPEPGMLGLIGAGFVAMGLHRRRLRAGR